MLQGLNLANPLRAKQAPNYKPLGFNTTLKVEGQELATPPIAQEYFEPGINVKLTRRSKPKTNYTLPSDMPSFPPGFVPINQTPGANGEEPAIIPQKELVPQDLLQVFQRVATERLAEERPVVKSDMGAEVARELMTAMNDLRDVRKTEEMIRKGFTADETATAMMKLREEKALLEAKAPAMGPTLEEAMAGMIKVPEGKRPIFVPEKTLTKAEKAAGLAKEEIEKGTQKTITSYLK